jgi:hypothetical protein
MRRLSSVASLAVLLVLAASSVRCAQMGGGEMGRGEGTGRAGGRRGAQAGAREGRSDADRIAVMLEPLGLPAAERTAAEKALGAKIKARQALRQDLDKLRETAANKRASQQQLARAIDQYTKAMERYRTLIRNEDHALSARLSTRGRAVCLAAGVLDNAMGMGSRSRGGGGGSSGPGGGRGGPSGGGGREMGGGRQRGGGMGR